MNRALRQQLLEQVLLIIRHTRPQVEAIERRDRDLGAQLKRSLSSIALNVSEAFGVHAGNARLSFRRALGELYESRAQLRRMAGQGDTGRRDAEGDQRSTHAVSGPATCL